jgi:hypothetical protein
MAPKDEAEASYTVWLTAIEFEGPAAIRFIRGQQRHLFLFVDISSPA